MSQPDQTSASFKHDTPQARAIAAVARRSAGPELDQPFAITINFHPDRHHQGMPLLEVLAREGQLHSQFVTWTSNGGLSAHRGGERWRWESRLFDGAYDDAAPNQRPKYGALNIRRDAVGAAPRFGSCHFRLRADICERATFCYPDSVFDPVHFATARHFNLMDIAAAGQADPLDDYIEAHVHGPVLLVHHVDALVLDPCYRGTDIERHAAALPCPVEWHAGFRVHTDALRDQAAYRGPHIVALAAALGQDGLLTPEMIGRAVREQRADAQDLKKVWHCLARFGAPKA